jgi:hypothetical protein
MDEQLAKDEVTRRAPRRVLWWTGDVEGPGIRDLERREPVARDGPDGTVFRNENHKVTSTSTRLSGVGTTSQN